MTFKLFGKIIWETFQWVALFGGLLGLVTGIALFFNSALVLRISERMNVWISTRQAMRPLEAPIEIERAVYRSHRIIGALLLIGALFTLYVLVLRFRGPEIVAALAKLFRLGIATWVAESVRIFLVLLNFLAVVIALTMVIRPSALNRVEGWANRQYSARRATRAWEIPRPGPDAFVASHPRLVGAALSLAGAYVLVVLTYTRFVGH